MDQQEIQDTNDRNKNTNSGNFLIYAIVNKRTYQKYIGQTRRTLDERWQQHVRTGGGHWLARAIKAFGKDSFVIFEIDRANTQVEANKKERALILAARSLFPAGYNAKVQGDTSYEKSDYRNLKQLWADLTPEEKKELGLTSPPAKRWFLL